MPVLTFTLLRLSLRRFSRTSPSDDSSEFISFLHLSAFLCIIDDMSEEILIGFTDTVSIRGTCAALSHGFTNRPLDILRSRWLESSMLSSLCSLSANIFDILNKCLSLEPSQRSCRSGRQSSALKTRPSGMPMSFTFIWPADVTVTDRAARTESKLLTYYIIAK